ncbi:MAG: methylaspartate mutase subunit S [Lentisphaeria bacterium]|nr:methylaspartate mutase subunit S [Lentisphaeria bacterium]
MGEREMTIVLGVIGADCHAVGNKILDRFFGDQGFKVVNLGVMVSQDEYIDAAIETGAEAIVVQSLYGHGEIDCQGFRERCTERGLAGIVMHVGGRLVVGKADPEEVRKKFLAMGFDRVVFPDDDLREEAEALRADILRRRAD